MGSVYDDSLHEWFIDAANANDSIVESNIRLKWPLRNDINEWVIDFGDKYYSVKMRWQSFPIQWEINGGENVVTMRQKWRGDPNVWIINYGDYNVSWQTLYPNMFQDWFFEFDENTFFEMWMRYEGDVRDWDINDKAANIPDEVKIAAIFTTVYLTIPKN